MSSDDDLNLSDDDSFFQEFKEEEFSDVSSIDNIEDIGNNKLTEPRDKEPSIILEDEFPVIITDIPNETPKPPISKKKRTKEDLNKTPLPIFDCIYCSNETVVFGHMVREILSDKYLINASQRDLEKINNIISNSVTNFDQDTQHLVNFIVTHTEYISKFHNQESSFSLLHAIISRDNNKKFNPNLKYKYYSYENNTLTLTLTMFRTTLAHAYKFRSNSNDIRFSSKNYVEISPNFSNFYSNSINFQKNEEEALGKNNNNEIIPVDEEALSKQNSECDSEDNIEQDNNQSFLRFLKFDLKRKFKKEDIIFEDAVQDIWNPQFSSDEENDSDDQDALNAITNINDMNEINELKKANSEENFSLQFSHNASTIHNLFDTNSNINIKCCNNADKSINNNINISHNASSANAFQHKTVWSYNSESIPFDNENNSLSLNKSVNPGAVVTNFIKLNKTAKETSKAIDRPDRPPSLRNVQRNSKFTFFKGRDKINDLSFPDYYHNFGKKLKQKNFTNFTSTTSQNTLLNSINNSKENLHLHLTNMNKSEIKPINIKQFTKFSDFKSRYLANKNIDKSNYKTINTSNRNSSNMVMLSSTKNSSKLLGSSFLSKSVSNNELVSCLNKKVASAPAKEIENNCINKPASSSFYTSKYKTFLNSPNKNTKISLANKNSLVTPKNNILQRSTGKNLSGIIKTYQYSFKSNLILYL